MIRIRPPPPAPGPQWWRRGAPPTELEAADAALAGLTGSVRGTVRLAAFPTAAAAFVPAAIARSRAEHPDLRVILSELETDEAVAAAARQALHSAEIGMIHRRPPM